MPELVSPALILVVAALAIGPARGHLRAAVVLLAPLLTLWAVWQVPDGVQDTVRFLSYQIEPVLTTKPSIPTLSTTPPNKCRMA